ncbi:MAG: deoxyguanosinetriphosphate triphosphohydrolase [Firmicutes bacterium]|nr:deoxyguanosinetriphosphate triphosphohydrolase [Bacillota bacterium]
MGNLRVQTERREAQWLSPLAAKASSTQGRAVFEPLCEVRTEFQRDRDRILHSKAFRRLRDKTQVFIAPEGDHYRTRLTHTLEVAQIARTVARALRLNEDLTEAIALGHDLGHTPFGHAGEAALNCIYQPGFRHNTHSLRVVDVLERLKPGMRGLNLTWEVRDGIANHSGQELPSTLEGQVVRLCDRIAYINHDIDDAVRAGILREEELPSQAIEVLGRDRSERIDRMVKDLISSSWDQSTIEFSPEVSAATSELREFLFATVYVGSSEAKSEEKKVEAMLRSLFEYYLTHPEEMPSDWHQDPGGDKARLVVDYIAGMTDRYAVNDYTRLFLPQFWSR